MKNPMRREYLDDFRKDSQGNYVYSGQIYRIDGSGKKIKVILLLLLLLSVLPAAAAGFTTAGGMKDTFYVIIPYILEVCCAFGLSWNVLRLLMSGESIKEYVLSSVSKYLPVFSYGLSIFAFISIVCITVFLVKTGLGGESMLSFALIACKLVSLLSSLILIRFFKKISFSKEDN